MDNNETQFEEPFEEAFEGESDFLEMIRNSLPKNTVLLLNPQRFAAVQQSIQRILAFFREHGGILKTSIKYESLTQTGLMFSVSVWALDSFMDEFFAATNGADDMSIDSVNDGTLRFTFGYSNVRVRIS